MIKVLIKSKYIHYGRQVQDTVIEMSEPELQMITDLKVDFEVVEEPKEAIKEPAYKRKKAKDDEDNV